MSTEITLKDTTLEERSVVEIPRNLVTAPNAPNRTKKVRAKADVLEEYVAAGNPVYQPWFGSTGYAGRYLTALPNPIDDLMMSFGSRLYDEDMMRDPQVYSVVSVLVMALLCQGVTYSNPIKEDEPDYELAEKILKLCEYCVENLNRPMPAVRYELAEGMLKMGHKVAEQIYESSAPVIDGYAGEMILLTDLKCRAHDATAFVVDSYSNTLGLSYVRPGESLNALGTYISETLADLRLIPLSKFVIPTHKPRNGDPRGTSHLKSVYSAWWSKQQMIPQHMAFVARFAQPSLVANLDKEAKDIPVYDAENNVTSHKSIITATTQALAKVKGGAVASFIATDVQMLEAKTEGKVIFDSYSHFDRQIAKGILWQTLTTEESQHMARAANATHQDVFGIGIQFLRDILEWSEKHEILYNIVFFNYGEEAARKFTPNVSYGEVQIQDIPKTMAALAQLALAGGIHPSMWPAIRQDLGLPVADSEAEAEDLKLVNEQKQAATDQLKKQITAPSSGVNNNPNASDNPRENKPVKRANE